MADSFRCWRCGKTIPLTPPFGRLEECAECRAPLHVCRMCRFFAPHLPTGCSEPDADEVRAKDRANFCDWFRPSTDAYTGEFAGIDTHARQAAEALFGGDMSGDPPSGGLADGKADQKAKAPEPESRQAAERLFGDDDPGPGSGHN